MQMSGRVKEEQNDGSVQSSQLHQGFKVGCESLEDKQRTVRKDVERGWSERDAACSHQTAETWNCIHIILTKIQNAPCLPAKESNDKRESKLGTFCIPSLQSPPTAVHMEVTMTARMVQQDSLRYEKTTFEVGCHAPRV